MKAVISYAMRCFWLLMVVMCIAACGLLDAEDTPSLRANAWEPWPFDELSEESVPPCLAYGGAGITAVIASQGDYERIRREHAPQGEYIDIQADGTQDRFVLPYQPLDADHDGRIGPNDLIIYVKGGAPRTTGGDELTSTNPIRMEGDSILVFWTSPPYTAYAKIHYAEVFTVDPATGSVTFANPPPPGSTVSISASDKLYEVYEQRACSLDYFDLADQIIIGKSVTGDGCLIELENNVFIDRAKREVIYQWRKVEDQSEGGCPEVAVQITKWVSVDRPPDGYNIVFVEADPVLE